MQVGHQKHGQVCVRAVLRSREFYRNGLATVRTLLVTQWLEEITAIVKGLYNIYGNKHCRLLIGKIIWLESESTDLG
jgi:hypothetical protein